MNPDESVSVRASQLFNDLIGRLVQVVPAAPTAANNSENSSSFKGVVVQGILIAADPLSSSVVLVTCSQLLDKLPSSSSPGGERSEAAAVVSVFLHAQSVTPVEEGAEVVDVQLLRQTARQLREKIASDVRGGASVTSHKALAAKREAVKRWLTESHQLCVEEEEEESGEKRLIIQGCVTLRAPYSAADCQAATNEIILSRVQELIGAFEELEEENVENGGSFEQQQLSNAGAAENPVTA